MYHSLKQSSYFRALKDHSQQVCGVMLIKIWDDLDFLFGTCSLCGSKIYEEAKSSHESDCNQGEVLGIKGGSTFCQKLILLSSRKMCIFSKSGIIVKICSHWAQNFPVSSKGVLIGRGHFLYSVSDHGNDDGKDGDKNHGNDDEQQPPSRWGWPWWWNPVRIPCEWFNYL